MRNIAEVTTAVANGDLSKKITVDVRGEVLELKETINTMVDQLRAFAAEVTRVAREVGTEGSLGGQASVEGVSGMWKDLTDNVNFMASNLTEQVRNIAQVTTAVATGDLSQKITVDVKGEILELKDTINTMVDQLSSFADEVTRVAREVGTEGKLGGQAKVKGVSGTWKDLTDYVNALAVEPHRPGAQHRRGHDRGREGRPLAEDHRRRARRDPRAQEHRSTRWSTSSRRSPTRSRASRKEVGTEGKLGGQAEVKGVSRRLEGPHRQREPAGASLTTQVRAIADVSTAVTQGDLTRADHRRGAGRGRRAQGQHQPDDRATCARRPSGTPSRTGSTRTSRASAA